MEKNELYAGYFKNGERNGFGRMDKIKIVARDLAETTKTWIGMWRNGVFLGEGFEESWPMVMVLNPFV